MKSISDMTHEEIINEVKDFETKKFKSEENFIFVSYSHKDSDIVLKTVLKWIRDGYNVAIDLDFQNHSSDENWIRLMEDRLSNTCCVKVACFRSEHYYFSYASLIELMLMRSDYLRRQRRGADNVEVPIDIIEISKAKRIGVDNDFDAIYTKQFEIMKSEIGNRRFFENKPKEREELKYGLETLCKSDKVDLGDAEECIKNIEKAFEQGKKNFYPYIQSLFNDWFIANDLNGNYKDINANLYVEFDEKNVYKFSLSENVHNEIIMDIKNENQNNEDNEDTATSDIKKEIKNILPEIVKEIDSDGKDVYTIDQKGEPHFYTKKMDEYLRNENKAKSVWGDDNLYRYEFKTFANKIGIRMTPSSTNASKETLEKMKKLHKLECVKEEGVNDNLKDNFIYGCVFYKKYNFNENISVEEKKELVKKSVLYALQIERKIFEEIGQTSFSKNKEIKENNSKPLNSKLTDEYIISHKNDKEMIEKDTIAEKLYVEFFNKFSPEKLKELNGIDLLRKVFLNDKGIQDNICSILEYNNDYIQFGSIKGGTALKHYLYYSAKDKIWKTGKPPVDVKNVTEEEAIAIGTKIRDNIVKACDIIEKNKENLKTEKDYKKLYEEISRDCDNVHKIIFVKKYFHMIYKDLFPCMFSGGYIRKVAEALNLESGLDDFDYIGKIEEKKNKFGISNRIFAEIVYKYFDEENIKYQSC